LSLPFICNYIKLKFQVSRCFVYPFMSMALSGLLSGRPLLVVLCLVALCPGGHFLESLIYV